MNERERMQRQNWEAPVGMIRVGDLVLTQTDGHARLWRARGDAATGLPAGAHRLPGKEAGLLAFLMRHHRQIVSKSRLIEAVWGPDGTAPGVLDVHMVRLRRILQHLDAAGIRARIETRRGMGYSLLVDEERGASSQ